ncbi:uncharacterized protein LOC130790656 [Actinidia eriantha]|uniref:uncharacterized protein LOC130790291 n=1 Tax=Actinidia eriantha TaxID=165200 RepID=UPI002582732F|nr:uncharacterized protein LOC130790291 [Actinidia eriantha]XP_057507651.1 uncharacterized protein LOC130790656 [Actinidia eriantha]
MSAFSRSAFSLVIFFVLCRSPTIRSDNGDPPLIRLHVHEDNPAAADDGGDPCGEIAAPASCPIKCFRTNPVCGVNGVTYWCGCADAACAGTRVAKLGFCEVGNGGSGSLSGQAFLLVHIVWLILLGFSVVFGLL